MFKNGQKKFSRFVRANLEAYLNGGLRELVVLLVIIKYQWFLINNLVFLHLFHNFLNILKKNLLKKLKKIVKKNFCALCESI